MGKDIKLEERKGISGERWTIRHVMTAKNVTCLWRNNENFPITMRKVKALVTSCIGPGKIDLVRLTYQLECHV